MTDTTSGSPAPRRRRWLRTLGVAVGVLVVLVVVAYFVTTSSAFFRRMILPRVSKAMNANITVSEASISPFHQVILRNLKIQTTGPEPVVTAAEVRLRYSLMDIIGGNIHVDEATLSSPTITVIENPDGSTDLDPILKAQAGARQKPASPTKPAATRPLQIDIGKAAITDATVRYVKNYANGQREVTELSHANLTLDDLKNGQPGKFALNADIDVQKTNAVVQAKLSGNFTFALTQDLKPASVQGGTHLEVTRAQGALAEAAGLGSDLKVNVTPTDVKEVELQFARAGTPLGRLRVSGPFDMAKLEGLLTIGITSIDRRLLNILGAEQGLDFGPTTISSTNQVELAQGGSVITARGQLDVNQFQVTRARQTTPRLDLRDQYDVTVDRIKSVATLRGLTLTGTENGNPILKAELTSPMQIAWGNVTNAVGSSALTLSVSRLNLADWRPFLGDSIAAGVVSATARLQSQQGGRQLGFDIDSMVNGLAVKAGSNELANAGIIMQAKGKTVDLKQFNLASSNLRLTRDGQMLLDASATGDYDQAAQTADLQVAVQAALDRVLAAVPQVDTSASSGTLNLKAHITQRQDTQDVAGNLVLTNLAGRFGRTHLADFGATADFDVARTPQQIQVRKAAGKLTQGGKPGGTFDLSANYDTTSNSGGLTAKLVDLNQNGIGPFLEPLLEGKTLQSVAINANLAAEYAPQGSGSLKGDLQVTNLVVKTSPNQPASIPLEAGMKVDVSTRNQITDVHQFQVTLTPTERAANQLRLTGQVDLTHTNAIQGNLQLAADSLDLTRYYDLFTAQSNVPQRAPAQVAQKIEKATPEKEPDPVKLPLHNFNASASIGRLYLREVEITNWQTTVLLDASKVVVNPFKLALNGAPVSSVVKVDLSRPGYQYNLSLSGQAIPLAPLVNTFEPQSQGQLGGTATVQGQLDGAGITGTSLQKNLTGEFSMSSTNLNLDVVNIRNPVLTTIINVVSTIPELLGNPVGKVASVVGGIFGAKGLVGGLSTELQQSPINTLIADVTIGAGIVNLRQAQVQSPAFEADATGTITLNADLTNSVIQIPVKISLGQAIGKKLNLALTSTVTNGYIALPDFVTIRGTLGAPKPDINTLALVDLGAKSVIGAVPSAGASTLGAIGNILGITSSGTNTPPPTNPPASTNPLRNLFRR